MFFYLSEVLFSGLLNLKVILRKTPLLSPFKCCLKLEVNLVFGHQVGHILSRAALFFSFQTVLGIVVPPTIAFKEFKTKKELCQMPVTFEEHELEQTKIEAEETGNEEKRNGNTALFSKGDSQVHLR